MVHIFDHLAKKPLGKLKPYYMKIPAMQAVIKQARVPAMRDFIPSIARSFLLSGAKTPIPPT